MIKEALKVIINRNDVKSAMGGLIFALALGLFSVIVGRYHECDNESHEQVEE